MDPERWRQIEDIYHAALEREPSQRKAFLTETCQGDEELRREVGSLLQQEGTSEDMLNRPAWELVPGLIEEPTLTLLTPGEQLGPYKIEAPLGAGGMGQVYKARDTRLGRSVAIKILTARFSGRFEREARAISALNHPHVCTLYDVGPNYLVMELVEGETLAARVKKGALALKLALDYGAQIADALAAAHARGIVHRDLKPANIMITKSGVKVLDFGLASMTMPPGETLTASHAVMGTPAYMAPEQLAGQEADARSDIYALGLVLYELITGERASGTLELRSLQPLALDRVVKTCLAREPDERWQDARDLKRELEWAASGDPAPPPAISRRAILPWIAGAAVAGGVGGAGIAAFVLRRHAAPSVMRLSVDLGEDAALSPIRGASMALSPDGSRLVFVIGQPLINSRLAMRRLDQAKAAPLAGTEGAEAPFFSPDGKWIAFFVEGKLKKMDLGGGAAVTLCDAPSPRGGSWGEDDTIVFAATNHGGISRVAADGGAPQLVTELDRKRGDSSHRYPQMLPGAEAVLFMNTANFSTGEGPIEAQSFKTGKRKTLIQAGAYGRFLPSGHLVYLHRGILFAAPMDSGGLKLTGRPVPVLEDVSFHPSTGLVGFTFSQSGMFVYAAASPEDQKRPIAMLDEKGRMEEITQLPRARYVSPRVSPDGKRLAVVMEQGSDANIWIYDWTSQRLSRLAFANGNSENPVWTPDGRHLVFSCDGETPGPGIYRMRADGAGSPQRLTEGRDLAPRSFSPRADWLAYQVQGGPSAGAWMLPLDWSDATLPKPGVPERFKEGTDPAFSPDGRWIAYEGGGSGMPEVFVRPFPGAGGPWQISSAGGAWPVWSRTGRELFFQNLPGYRIVVAGYSVAGDSFTPAGHRSWNDAGVDPGGFDVMPDGKRVVAILAAEQKQATHATFLLNFMDDLRRRLPAGK